MKMNSKRPNMKQRDCEICFEPYGGKPLFEGPERICNNCYLNWVKSQI